MCHETQNDFIREYLAAQQARFQVQREAKKQFEEQKRESEASAEETTQDEDEPACYTPSKKTPRKALHTRLLLNQYTDIANETKQPIKITWN